MTVYVVYTVDFHEFQAIEGVFATQEAADKYIDDHEKDDGLYWITQAVEFHQ